MSKTIQRVELNTFYYVPIHCPFCGTRVANYDGDEPELSPCEHTLFIAHDVDFEYRSSRFDENLKLVGVDNDDVADQFGDDWEGIDDLTNKVTLPDSVKFAAYVGPPSGEGSYYGFAPTEDE